MSKPKYRILLIDKNKTTVIIDDTITQAVDFAKINIEDVHKHDRYKDLFNTIRTFIEEENNND